MGTAGIGQKLREARKNRSLTQRQVANYVEVTEATVSRWESGEIDNMRRDKIAKLAAALEISPLLIMGIETDGAEKALVLSEKEETLVQNYRKLDESKRHALDAVISAFVTQQAAAVFGNVIQAERGNASLNINNGSVKQYVSNK